VYKLREIDRKDIAPTVSAADADGDPTTATDDAVSSA